MRQTVTSVVLVVLAAGVHAAPPIIEPVGSRRCLSSLIAVQEGEYLEVSFAATDPDGDPVTLAVENLPGWLSFDPATGVLTGRAPAWAEDTDERWQQPGTFDLTLTATDGEWTVGRIVSVQVRDSRWEPMGLAELIASRPLAEPCELNTPVELHDVDSTVIWSELGGGRQIRRVCFAFTSQVPDVEGWEGDWLSTSNCAYLPLDAPAVPNVGAVVEGAYSQDFGDRELGERACAELGVPVLVIDRGWAWDYPSELMGRYNQEAIERRDPRYLFYAFTVPHFLRAADALGTVMEQEGGWQVDLETFQVVLTGFSKLGHTAFLSAAGGGGNVAGFMSAGAAGLDGDLGRLLGRVQGATTSSPEGHFGYLGTMMRAYVTDFLAQGQADAGTVAYLTLGTNDGRGEDDGYTAKYSMLVSDREITLPHSLLGIPNGPHTTKTQLHSTAWRMLLAHVLLGRPLSEVESVGHRATVAGLEVNAAIAGGTTLDAVNLWYTTQGDMDIGAWDGFTKVSMDGAAGAYSASIPGDATAYFVEVLDEADHVPGIVSSPPAPVNRDYPLLGIAPGDVTRLGASFDRDRISLAWENPDDSDLAGVLVVLRQDGHGPSSPGDGAVVCDGRESACEVAVEEGAGRCHLAVFTYDADGNYSAGVPIVVNAQSPRRPAGRVGPVNVRPSPAGSRRVVYVPSDGIGDIAVRIEVPVRSRYSEGAPVVVEVSTWFTDQNRFHRVNDTTRIGAVTISYLWPGREDRMSGVASEGEYDYGGPVSLAALRDVIRFAAGEMETRDGWSLQDLVAMPVLTDNLGLFASSHSGVVATNVLAYFGRSITGVRYLVGRENPTSDEMYSLEIGHFDDNRRPVLNPYLDETDYSATRVALDCSTVGWFDDGSTMPRPYFAASGDRSEHVLHEAIAARMWGKRYYSQAITRALFDNGALGEQGWPDDLATPEEAERDWPYRTTVNSYPLLASEAPDLRVMLVFAAADHVQAAPTKPHIRQAWDGFVHAAGLWARMNPDRAYVVDADQSLHDLPDNPALTEPDDWRQIGDWGFEAGPGVREVVWLAAVAEMADRVEHDAWDADLDQVLEPTLVGP